MAAATSCARVLDRVISIFITFSRTVYPAAQQRAVLEPFGAWGRRALASQQADQGPQTLVYLPWKP
jgi:hypothetical protein